MEYHVEVPVIVLVDAETPDAAIEVAERFLAEEGSWRRHSLNAQRPHLDGLGSRIASVVSEQTDDGLWVDVPRAGR